VHLAGEIAMMGRRLLMLLVSVAPLAAWLLWPAPIGRQSHIGPWRPCPGPPKAGTPAGHASDALSRLAIWSNVASAPAAADGGSGGDGGPFHPSLEAPVRTESLPYFHGDIPVLLRVTPATRPSTLVLSSYRHVIVGGVPCYDVVVIRPASSGWRYCRS
jgi:hypothetical protein